MQRPPRTSNIPQELTDLFEFVNSNDADRFVHQRLRRLPDDKLASTEGFRVWMLRRGLLKPGIEVTPPTITNAIQLRSCLRAFLECAPGERQKNKLILQSLNRAIEPFPLVAEASGGRMKLQPAGNDALAGLSSIVAELYDASASDALNRLKMCAAKECRAVFSIGQNRVRGDGAHPRFVETVQRPEHIGSDIGQPPKILPLWSMRGLHRIH